MRMYDIIDRKKRGEELTLEEINFAVNRYVAGEIPDYQMSAFLMAVYFQGMTDEELLNLTNCMMRSGDTIDLSGIKGVKVDKHSTGGVGDKTSIIVGPMVASCGGKVAKMSGRGLGFTGGTIDKLEVIPGMRTDIGREDFFRIVDEVGIAIIGQTEDVAPADKKIYALRDVTATVDSIPLIAASIMSKKLAIGSDKIVLDVTVGSGAFMKTVEDALLLAKKMVAIGEGTGRETVALLTNMDVPLGKAVGNDCEIMEAVDVLRGEGLEDIRTVCVELTTEMLFLSGLGDRKTCRDMARNSLDEGQALDRLASMVEKQGGDYRYIYHAVDKFKVPRYTKEILAPEDGYIVKMNTELCGKTAVVLGAGRETKESAIDSTASILFFRKTGDFVEKGDSVATICSSSEEKIKEAEEILSKAIFYGPEKPEVMKPVIARVTKDGVEMY